MVRERVRHAVLVVAPLAVVGFALAGTVLAAGQGPSEWTPVIDPDAPASVTEVDGAEAVRHVGRRGAYVQRFAPQAAATFARSVEPTASAPPVRIPGQLGIPQIVLDAYHKGAAGLAESDPSCHLRWEVLAGIGQVESGHARQGLVYADGRTFEPILGPRLDGAGGFAAIPDTDDGRLDGDPVWDRAVGPMQFIPGTWRWTGVDGNDDGTADPHNVYDAARSAGRYLCTGSADLSDRAALTAALLRYNHSDAYVALVLAWIDGYIAGRVTPLPPADPPPSTAPPTSTTTSLPPTTVATTASPTTTATTSSTPSVTISVAPPTTTQTTTSAAETTSASTSPPTSPGELP